MRNLVAVTYEGDPGSIRVDVEEVHLPGVPLAAVRVDRRGHNVVPAADRALVQLGYYRAGEWSRADDRWTVAVLRHPNACHRCIEGCVCEEVMGLDGPACGHYGCPRVAGAAGREWCVGVAPMRRKLGTLTGE